MISLNGNLVLQAAASAGTARAQVMARTINQYQKPSYEEYQTRNTRTVTTTPATICEASPDNAFKAIDSIAIANNASITKTVAVFTYDGVRRDELIVHDLKAFQCLHYEGKRGWYTTSGSSVVGFSSGVIGIGIIGIFHIGQP